MRDGSSTRGSPWRRTAYATSFVDIERGRLLDVVPGRNADDVAYWLFGATSGWKADVRTVAIDPHRGYANGLLRGLPDAVVTVDHFHAVKLANEAINDVRRRVQNETLGRRGHRDDPLYRTRRLMTRGWERLALSLPPPPGHVAMRLAGLGEGT